MAPEPPHPQDPEPNDLFGRWLAHREHGSDPGPAEQQAAEKSPPEPPPGGSRRRLPAAAVASSAVERDPMIGSRIAPPSNFGTRRTPPASGGPEPDRQAVSWEPIVMRSARKKAEEAEAKQTPKVERAGRLQRLKARLVDPAETAGAELADEHDDATPLLPPIARAAAPPVAPAPAPAPAAPTARTPKAARRKAVAPEPAPAPTPSLLDQPPPLPVRSPAPPSPATRPIEETIREAAPAAPAPAPVRRFVEVTPFEPDPEPAQPATRAEPVVPSQPVAPRPLPVVAKAKAEPAVAKAEPAVAKARPVVAKPQPAVAKPQPVAARPDPLMDDPEPGPAEEKSPAPAGGLKSLLSRGLRPSRKDEAPADPARVQTKDRRRVRPPLRGTSDAARDLVAAKARARAAAPTPPSADPEPQRPAEGVPAAAARLAPKLAKISRHDEVAAEMPGVYAFKPKRAVRRLLTLALLGGLGATAYFVRIAVQTKGTPQIGVAVIAAAAAVMIWAIRAGASVTTLTVHQGQLEVVQQGARFVFDMSSQYTMVEVHGQPGDRRWHVLFPRGEMAPFKVDAAMVDPDDFMRVLRFFRPQLRH